MRNIPLLAVSSIALLIGCTEHQSLPSALTPGHPNFVTYTASTGAPSILGAWNGSSYTIAYDINDLGTIVGVSDDASITAVGWATGTNSGPKSTTPFLISNAGAVGRAVNAVGQVAGEIGSHAGLWTPVPKSTSYTATDIGAATLFVGATISAAYGINASGQVVGSYRVNGEDKCFLWTPSSTNGTTGTAVEIPGLGGTFCVANDINSSGQIAGASTLLGGGPNHAFVSIGGAAAIDLQPGTDESYGAAINNAGQVAGYHTPAIGPTSAAVWTPSGSGWGSASDLGTPTLSGQSGPINSAALDINDAGYVVGYTSDQQAIIRAFFWQGTAFTELPDAGVSIVQANALTNVMANRVIVTGSDIFNATNGRHGLRWVVTLKR